MRNIYKCGHTQLVYIYAQYYVLRYCVVAYVCMYHYYSVDLRYIHRLRLHKSQPDFPWISMSFIFEIEWNGFSQITVEWVFAQDNYKFNEQNLKLSSNLADVMRSKWNAQLIFLTLLPIFGILFSIDKIFFGTYLNGRQKYKYKAL